MQYFTAYGALVMQGGLGKDFESLGNGNSGKKQTVLVTAASSSVGYAAIQICLKEGATVIATTRSSAKKQALLDAGAHHVIVTGGANDAENQQQDLVKEILKITEAKGIDIVFDAIAGPLVLSLAKAAAFEGKIILYGALSLESTVFPLQLAIKKGLSISGYSMMQITEDVERMEIAKQYVLDGLTDGTLKPVVDKVFSFEQLKEAHEYMESNQQQGKIVVKVS
jgi:NADPH:quinone reductase-like Zn-dependent oxidoreductase